MSITINKSFDIYNLYAYAYSNELISESDEYTMHMISKIQKNNPMNKIVNPELFTKHQNAVNNS